MKLKIILLWGTVLVVQFSYPQNFKLMRYDEDYSALKDSTRSFYNKIKYIRLSQNGNTYLSMGGEIRGELDYVQNEDWGEKNLGRDIFSLQRYHLHADFHLGNRFRVFGQLRSGLENGRKNGPRPIDEDKLNVQNLFLDIMLYKNVYRNLTIRMGRQEIHYGSGRLIDVREGPNLRLYFDGLKLAYSTHKLSLDAFVMSTAIVNTGVFDNKSTRKPNLWGGYGTFFILKGSNLDFYYLGINRPNSRFNEGVSNEHRHTFGSRFWRIGKGFVYNFETGYQLGSFGLDNISAYAISSEVGYMFEFIKGSPTLRLRSDYISGDKAIGDGKLGTFNAMYPNGGYFGINPQIGPANLISAHPNLILHPGKQVNLTMDVVLHWRQSIGDGIYGPNGFLRMPSSNSSEKYIGTAYMTTFSWNVNNFLSYNLGVQYFKTGSFINDVIPDHKDGFFVGSVIRCKF
ncbi:alginate export family protein [Belliella marina]|uniref:Alginate export family protein n=1 Tax=Belliella marina TaxID=1644146 RepID=A0ABW4VL32_9BACT